MVKTSRWNTADHLKSNEMVIEYLACALEEDGPGRGGNHASLVKSVENAVDALRRLSAAEQENRSDGE